MFSRAVATKALAAIAIILAIGLVYEVSIGVAMPPGSAQGQVYGPAQEIANVSKVYRNANATTFSCNADADCTLVHDSLCFNNLASQQACIGGNYASVYASAYSAFLSQNRLACAQYFVSASARCICISGAGCGQAYKRA